MLFELPLAWGIIVANIVCDFSSGMVVFTIMTRQEFKAHVEETIESVIQVAEKRIDCRFVRRYCFNWIGAKTEPVPQEQVVEFVTVQVINGEALIGPLNSDPVDESSDKLCFQSVILRSLTLCGG